MTSIYLPDTPKLILNETEIETRVYHNGIEMETNLNTVLKIARLEYNGKLIYYSHMLLLTNFTSSLTVLHNRNKWNIRDQKFQNIGELMQF